MPSDRRGRRHAFEPGLPLAVLLGQTMYWAGWPVGLGIVPTSKGACALFSGAGTSLFPSDPVGTALVSPGGAIAL